MPRIIELRNKRAEIAQTLDNMTKTADAEKREFNSEEAQKFDELIAKNENLRADIEREEKRESLQRELEQKVGDAEKRAHDQNNGNKDAATKQMDGLRSWIVGSGMNEEFRNLQVDVDTQGGFLVTPEQFINQLIKSLDDEVSIRGLATVFQVPNANSLGAPTLDSDPDDADWTDEIKTGNEDSSMKFGKRELKPTPIAKRIKVSNTLLNRGVMNVENIVIDRLRYKFGITEEKAFLNGNGNGQPLGIFTASSKGISASRDISENTTTTEITADSLINCEYSLKSGYRNKANWLMHRDCIKKVRKLKDNENRYLLNIQDGTINGIPYKISEFAPNTFTAGNYVAALGDFSKYWIADALNMQLKRLEELYSETNQTGFIGRKETDGMPVLEEAFARLKLADS